MQELLMLAGSLAFFGIIVGVPLSILRSLDEIKARQKRIESRLDAIEANLLGAYDPAR